MARREAPEINGGSLADIAFMLLIFFLVATTMDTDFGLPRLLPPPLPPTEVKPPPIKERNVFIVLINSFNQLMVEGEPLDISQLKDKAKEFIANPDNVETLPAKKIVKVDFFGDYEVSKQVISLQNDKSTHYDIYIQVHNELAKAYKELKDELAQRKFGKKFAELNIEKQKAIKKIYPNHISEADQRNIENN